MYKHNVQPEPRQLQHIVWALGQWRHYLEPSPHKTIIQTDHAPLKFLPNCGRSQKCVRASRQLAAPLALRCNVRCTFVDDRPVCGYGRSLRRCPCAAAHASVADRSTGARGTEFTTRTDLQSQTGTSGPNWSEYHNARMFNNNLGVSHYISPMANDAALSRVADPSVSLIPHHCSCPSIQTDPIDIIKARMCQRPHSTALKY